jgi:HAD superfamily hydrolase (TIGR01509 family)
MPANALVFDCDGVLAETERNGHRLAFNRTFREFGLDVEWSEEEYGQKLLISGGKERVASILTPAFVRAHRLPEDAGARRAWLERFQARKTETYAELVRAGGIGARPGVVRIVDEARAAGWLLAVASTSSEESVRLTLEQAVGAERAAAFAVFAGDVVPVKKPDPAIYDLARTTLGTARSRTLVIEDSRNGLLAARAAGLRCVVTVSSYTRDEDFAGAALVVSSLGDPGETAEIFANRSGATPNGRVTLEDIAAVLDA